MNAIKVQIISISCFVFSYFNISCEMYPWLQEPGNVKTSIFNLRFLLDFNATKMNRSSVTLKYMTSL